jgi:hypothetical protein
MARGPKIMSLYKQNGLQISKSSSIALNHLISILLKEFGISSRAEFVAGSFILWRNSRRLFRLNGVVFHLQKYVVVLVRCLIGARG